MRKKKAEWVLWTVHEKLKKGFHTFDRVRCNACLGEALFKPNSDGQTVNYILSQYCPNCGAKMVNGHVMKDFDRWE